MYSLATILWGFLKEIQIEKFFLSTAAARKISAFLHRAEK